MDGKSGLQLQGVLESEPYFISQECSTQKMASLQTTSDPDPRSPASSDLAEAALVPNVCPRLGRSPRAGQAQSESDAVVAEMLTPQTQHPLLGARKVAMEMENLPSAMKTPLVLDLSSVFAQVALLPGKGSGKTTLFFLNGAFMCPKEYGFLSWTPPLTTHYRLIKSHVNFT